LNDQIKGHLNISRLRKFALDELPRNWALREVLLAENEEIDTSVFLALLPLWLRLSALGGGQGR
jgi:hypothetical protein